MLKKNITLVVVVLIILISCLLLVFFMPSYKLKYVEEVNFYSKGVGISNALVFAVIKAESDFNASAISNKNAIGLMQIKKETASYIMNGEITEEALKLPSKNIEIGTRYLKYLFDKFKDFKIVVCAYNAGEGNVLKWLKNREYSFNNELVKIPIKETNDYYNKVCKYNEKYQKILTKKDLKINF